jgi:hypothetical protein
VTAETKQPEVSPQDDEETILDLDELEPVRAPVVLKGKRYEVRTPQEFDIQDEHVFRTELADFTALQQKQEKLTKGENARLRDRIEKLFDKVLIASKEDKATFNDKQKQYVVSYFQLAVRREDSAALETMAPKEMKDLMERARDLGSTTVS